jgi:hypothetical protein
VNENRINFLADHQHVDLPGARFMPPAVEKALTALQEAVTAREEAYTALAAFERQLLDGREDLRHSPQHAALREAADAASRVVSERRGEAAAVADEHAAEWAEIADKGYRQAAAKVGRLVGQLAEALADADGWASVGVMVSHGAGRLNTQHQAWTGDPRRFQLAQLYGALAEFKLPETS